MNREETLAYLTAERPLKAEAVGDPRGLAEQYPFCNVFHTMAAEYAHATGDPGYEERLRVAAVYAYNRELLYDLLMRPSLERTVRAFETAVGEDAVEASTAAAVAAEAETVPASEPSLEVTNEEGSEPEQAVPTHDEAAVERDERTSIHPQEKEEETAVETVDAIEDVAFEESVADEQLETAPAPELPVKRASEYDDLQREILLEAINSSIELEVMGDDDASEAPEEGETIEQMPTAEPEPPKSAPAVEGKSAYARWLLQHSRFSEEPTQAEAATEQVDPKAKQSALIERFIANDPKITPGKAEFFSTENLAKMSLVEDEEFVTETMAMIYARQGHLKKAIRAYTLLGLKYPEKSVYFANQIKRLQQRPK